MAEARTAPEHPYDPLWSGGRRRRSRWSSLAILASIAAHAGVVAYVYETRFVPAYKTYQDKPVAIEVRPVRREPPPPSPAPKTPPPKPAAEPPRIDLHQTPAPTGLAAPITLPIAPLEPPPLEPPRPVEPVTPPPKVISRPNWSARPSGEDMARFYPERAQRLGVSGRATLQCQVTARGAVDDCTVAGEDPAGYGFGDAALRLSRLFRMMPKMEDGEPVEGATVRIPILFNLAD